MAFPGDKQQPGGWTPPQPPQSPYGPAEDQAAQGGSLFDPSYGSGSSGGAERSNPYGGGPGPYDQPPPYGYGAERADGFGHDPYGPGEVPGGHGQDPMAGYPEGPYGGGPGRYGPLPGDDGADPFAAGEGDRSGGTKKPLIIGAAVAVGVVVIGGGTALALSSGGGGDKPKPTAATTQATTAPASPTPPPTPTPTETGKGQRLASRATDPRPLTVGEVFKNKRFKAGGRVYAMTVRRSDHECATGVNGTAFRKALVRAGCTQILRATYSNGKFIGTIGVLNLKTEAVARAAQKASRPKDAYVIPLLGSTKKGLSLTSADPDGHYLIMSWVQYPNGKNITKSDRSSAIAFIQNATLGSNLRPALNYRSMVGKPE